MDTVSRIMDDVVPRKTREEYWSKSSEYAKKNPLMFSFMTTQAAFSALPIAIFLTISASTLIITLSTALLTSIGVISATALATLPFLVLTASTATMTWAVLVSTYSTLNYLWNNIYVDSSIQRDIATIRKNTSQIKHEIDVNGTEEFNHYLSSAKQVGAEVNNKAHDGYMRVKDTSVAVGRDVRDSAYDAGRNVKQGIENGATNVKQGIENGADKAANVANGVGNGAKGLKDDLFADDGIVDGVKAKTNRVAGGFNPENNNNYVVKNY